MGSKTIELVVKGHIVCLSEAIDEVEGACVEVVILLPHNASSLYNKKLSKLRLGRVSLTQRQELITQDE